MAIQKVLTVGQYRVFAAHIAAGHIVHATRKRGKGLFIGIDGHRMVPVADALAKCDGVVDPNTGLTYEAATNTWR